MIYTVIATGSKGNAVVLSDCILIDCGVPFKKLEDVCWNLRIVLLTHVHGDHFNKRTVKKLAAERPTLRFACGAYLVPELLKCGVSKRSIDVVEAGKIYHYKSLAISPVILYHDVQNFGYRIFWGGEKAIYATDTGTLDGISAKGYDLYLIEANYTDAELKERLIAKRRNGEYAYEKRVPYTHLSQQQADDFICENAGVKSEVVYLHKHGGVARDSDGESDRLRWAEHGDCSGSAD